MPTYCPRDKCAWTSPDGKCHWPGKKCLYQAKRDAAQRRLQERRIAAAKTKARERIKVLGIASAAGVYQRKDGRWRVIISTGNKSKGTYKQYRLGTYDTMQEAAAVRHLAELHRKNGDLAQWMESRRAGE